MSEHDFRCSKCGTNFNVRHAMEPCVGKLPLTERPEFKDRFEEWRKALKEFRVYQGDVTQRDAVGRANLAAYEAALYLAELRLKEVTG